MKRHLAAAIASAAAVLSLVLASCAQIQTRVDTDPTADLSGRRLYRWSERPGPTAAMGREVLDPQLDRQIRSAAERALATIDWRRANAGETATVILHDDAGVQTEVVSHHPYHSGYAATEHEYGLIQLEVVDARTRKRCWSGSARSRLRVSARGAGVYRLRLAATDAGRSWDVDDSVQEIVSRLAASR